ncbi:MlaD family protein [Rhodocyclaceae bacterium SMB388]
MENRAHALAAGLFALLLGAAVVFALWWFSDTREELRTYHLVSTGSVGGLNPQAVVRFRGISAGKVNSIRIDPDDPRTIVVSIGINADLPVTRGTRASLGYQGVTGLAFIQLDDRGLDPTPLSAVDGRPPRIALEAGLIDQLSDTAMDAMQRFRELSDRVGTFFDDENLGRFRGMLATLESAAQGVDRTFQEAPELLAALRDTMSQLMSKQNLDRLTAILANLEDVSRETRPMASEIRALLVRLDAVLGNVDDLAQATGDTVMDVTLPQLNSLLIELTDTSARLGRLIDEIDATPQMLITGRSERRPGPGEAGFQVQR